jgi:hypothetical protein
VQKTFEVIYEYINIEVLRRKGKENESVATVKNAGNSWYSGHIMRNKYKCILLQHILQEKIDGKNRLVEEHRGWPITEHG